MTQWLDSNFVSNGDGTNTSRSLKILVNGKTEYPLISASGTITGGTLTANIPLELNREILFGKCAAATLAPAVFITADDLKAELSVKDSAGQDYEPIRK